MKHLIKINTPEHGTISVFHDGRDSQYCEAGEPVTIDWQPSAGWGLQEAHLVTASGRIVSIDLETRTFTMPDEAVTIGATFKRFVVQDWTDDADNAGKVLGIDDNGGIYPTEAGGGGATIVATTYTALKQLRDGGNLAPGTWYRITDYVTTTSTQDTYSAEHPFDILVLATDARHLNENAFAAHHEGDTYFANSDLEAWRLKYCLDNDTTRFAWADTSNGKGVVYRMVDEFRNDFPLDFKNIIMDGSFVFMALDGSDASLAASSRNFDNTMGDCLNANGVAVLPFCYMEGTNHHGCRIGNNCLNWSCGAGCNSWSCGIGCSGWQCGNNCSNWSCGSNCISWTCGNGCSGWQCGNDTSNWTCGNGCSGWKCGNNTSNWTCGDRSSNWQCGCSAYSWACGNECNSWTCGNECYSWTCGNSCSNWSCGNGCSNWSCGNSCSNWMCGNNCLNWSCGAGCNSWSCGNSSSHWKCGTSCSGWKCGNNSISWQCGNECKWWTCGNNSGRWQCGNYTSNWTCGDDCQFWKTTNVATSANSPLQYFVILSGTKGSGAADILFINLQPNVLYQQVVGRSYQTGGVVITPALT